MSRPPVSSGRAFCLFSAAAQVELARLDFFVAKFQINAKPRGGSASCPLCSETLARGGPARECPGCEVSYHAACLEELGGCGTLGCARAKRIATAPPRRAAPRAARGSSEPSSVIGVVIAGVVVTLLLVAFKTEEAPEPPRRPAAPAERWRRPLDSQQVSTFVGSVEFLRSVREMEERVGSLGSSLDETLEPSRDDARQAYESLLESTGRTPAEIHAELAREVRDFVMPKDYAAAEEIMREIFAAVDGEPLLELPGSSTGDEFSTARERELQKVAELIAAGRESSDPEVREHLRAAAALGRAAEEAAMREGMSGPPPTGG